MPFSLRITPLGYTEYCSWLITSPSLNYSKAIKLNVVAMQNAQLLIFVNHTNLQQAPKIPETAAQLGHTYQFRVRDRILLMFRSSATRA
jgi:hypothetical protein